MKTIHKITYQRDLFHDELWRVICSCGWMQHAYTEKEQAEVKAYRHLEKEKAKKYNV